MKNLIRKILVESAKEKFINTMADKLKSGVIKAPYFENLNKFEVSKAELKEIFKKFFGDDVTIKRNTIFDSTGNELYFENSIGQWYEYEYDDRNNRIHRKYDGGHWSKSEYDDRGNIIYHWNSDGQWERMEYDNINNLIYIEYSNGDWEKYRYDKKGDLIYRENAKGVIVDKR